MPVLAPGRLEQLLCHNPYTGVQDPMEGMISEKDAREYAYGDYLRLVGEGDSILCHCRRRQGRAGVDSPLGVHLA